MAREYEHLMRRCKICHGMYNYKERGGKKSKTCSDRCSRENERRLRAKASREWRSRQRKC